MLANEIVNTALKESYLKVVLAVMNGDAKIQVGTELFECRGGSLGPSDLNKRS